MVLCHYILVKRNADGRQGSDFQHRKQSNVLHHLGVQINQTEEPQGAFVEKLLFTRLRSGGAEADNS